MDPKLVRELIAIVGEDNYTDRLIDLVSYASDASGHSHRPEAAVWPLNTGQVSKIMSLAYEHRIPVTPRGAGTGLAGSAIPEKGGIVLDMARMNKILDIRLVDRQAIVQAGVVYDDLQRALKPHGFFYPPDPASGRAATLGGNVATNAGGLKGAKYGVTKHYVLGLRVVLADGSVQKTGSNCLKCVSGYDLTSLFVGSEGTLGVITEIILKVIPEPTEKATCMAAFADLVQAGKAIAGIMGGKTTPCVLEILDEVCIRRLNDHYHLDLPPVAALLLAETDAFTKGEADFQIDRIIEIMKTNQAGQVTKAGSRKEAEELWFARRSLGGAFYALKSAMLSEDVTVPPSKISDLLKGIHEISRKHDILIATLGHVGDGNLHPNLLFDRDDPQENRRAEAATADLFKLTVDLGGTLTGEHGIGLAKAPFIPLEHDEIARRSMKAVKQALDPRNILNPGKMALDSD